MHPRAMLGWPRYVPPTPPTVRLDELDMDGLYERYLVTCAMSGVEPVSRERAGELVCVAPERF